MTDMYPRINPEVAWPGTAPAYPVGPLADTPLGRVAPAAAAVDEPEVPEFTRFGRSMGAYPPPPGPTPPVQAPPETADEPPRTYARATESDAVADPERPEKTPQTQVKYRFIGVEHVPGNAERIAEALDGCKVAVFEANGGTDEERAAVQRALDEYLDPDLPPDQKAAVGQYLEQMGMEMEVRILDNRPPSLVRATIFDMGAEHPDYQTTDNIQRLAETLDEAITLANASNAWLRENLAELIDLYIADGSSRHPVMAEQLADIATREMTDEPETFGVVTGWPHVAVETDVSTQGFECTVTPPLLLNIPRIPLELELRLHHDPTTPISTEDLDRVLREQLNSRYGYGGDLAYAFAKLLPAPELSALMAEVDAYKHTGTPLAETHENISQAINRVNLDFIRRVRLGEITVDEEPLRRAHML